MRFVSSSRVLFGCPRSLNSGEEDLRQGPAAEVHDEEARLHRQAAAEATQRAKRFVFL